MSSWFRAFLMWLLMAALPVQGWAAASMVNCGPSHHKMAAESVAEHDSMGRHSGHPHDHDAVAGASDADGGGSQPADTNHHSLQKLGKFKCSACASCCVGAALPSAVLSFDPSVSADTIVPDISQAVSVFLTGGLERPPRTILA